ncbi:MAG: SdrD B-like domain-containing protein, partial [Bacteroidota bacterium]
SSQIFNIGQPPLLEVNVEGFNGSCGSNGYANANVSGGSNPFTYKWSNGATTQSAGNLTPGMYAVTVTDAHECTAVDSAAIELIPVPVCNIELTQYVGAINGSDGQLTVQLDTGALPFTVKWNDGQTTLTAINLPPGNHIATITDANNCTAVCNFQLYNPGEIGDFAWLDTDKDGIQDVAETGLAGAQIKLSGINQYGDTVSVETTSTAAGAYKFIAQPGTYKLAFLPPDGYANSPYNQTGNDYFDSDPNPLTLTTAEFVLGQGETNLSVDGGFFVAEPCENFTSPGSICCDQTLCGPGQEVAILAETAAPAGGSGDAQFLWMTSNLPPPFNPDTWTPLLDNTEASLDPGLVQQTTWYIRLARRKGCIEFLESNIVQVAVDSVAIAEIIADDTTCLDVPVDFSATENAGATYAWVFEGALPDNGSAQHVHGVTWEEFGEKTVTLLVSKDGCTSMDELSVYVSNIPVYCGDALIINAELDSEDIVVVDWYYSFTDSVTRTYTVEWKWENDEFEAIGNEDSMLQIDSYLHFFANHSTPKRGKNYYRVRLNDSNGTELISNEVEVIYKGDYSLVHVFPNPFSGDLQVDILDRYDKKITMELFSPEGKLLGKFEATEKEDKMTLPTEDLPAGVYFLFVRYENEPQKIVKLVKWN